jgi:SpoIID/LytB domain protein
MSVVKEPEEKKKIPEPPAPEIHDMKINVRVGILENESNILFSCSGLFTVLSNGKSIFTKKKSQGSWKITAQGENLLFENIETGEIINVIGELIFRPDQISSYVKIGKVPTGKGWHWESSKSRSYKGNVEFLSINGKITVVNEVGIEQYLYGVVPSEMSAESPMEALKAQAVLARTNVFSKVGKKYQGKPYSLSSDVYSQVYTGVDKISERTSRAVDDTRGLILTYNGKPVEALFHSVCGGFIESNDIIWGSTALPYLRPKPCMPQGSYNFGDLSKENNFIKWINSKPASHCNLEGKPSEGKLSYANKYFRWETKYDRKKLEGIIRASTGTDIGNLNDITVLSRGPSGKAVGVKVTGSKNSVVINKELNIRQKLSKPPLYSGNFYVEKRNPDKNGLASEFVFKGAGFGHGTGMCQIGACGMADSGSSYYEILQFYFSGTTVTELDK